MPATLTIFDEVSSMGQTVTLDGVQYSIRVIWHQRRGAWFLDLRTAEGVAIALHRRLSPGWFVLPGRIAGAPPGMLFVEGSDPYARDGVSLVYYDRAELEAVV